MTELYRSGILLAVDSCMNIKKQLKKHIGKKATKRLYKKMPWLIPLLAFASSSMATSAIASAFPQLRKRQGKENFKESSAYPVS